MKTNRIFTALCIISCLTFFATSRNSAEGEGDDEYYTSSTGSTKGDTAATKNKGKDINGEPLPNSKGTSSTRAKSDHKKMDGSAETGTVSGSEKTHHEKQTKEPK